MSDVITRLVAEAVEAWPQFDGDEPVAGADLVEWFCEWRGRAKVMLAEEEANTERLFEQEQAR